MKRRTCAIGLWIIFGIVSAAHAEKSAQDFVDALREDDVSTAQAAEESLVKIGPDSVRPLQKALNDSNFLVRRRAAETLGRLGPPAKKAAPDLVLLLGDPQFDVHAAADNALVQIGNDAIPALSDALTSNNDGLRKVALTTLSRFGPKAVPLFMRLLKKDDNAYIRASAAEALGNSQPAATETVLALMQALNDLDEGVRGAAVDSLGQCGAASMPAIGPLFSISQEDKDALVRKKASDALIQIGRSSKETGDAVAVRYEQLLKNEETTIREQAIEKLGNLGPAGLPGLIQALSDRDNALSDEAGKAIVQLGPDAIPSLQTLQQSPYPYLSRKASELIKDIQKKSHKAKK